MGCFSWITQDTNKSISSCDSIRKAFRVFMVNPKTGEVFPEDNYEGYGVFGGKDYYELLAELNGLGADRDEGIDLALSSTPNVLSPILVEHLDNWKKYIGQTPKDCPRQGFFYDIEEITNEKQQI